MNEPILYRRNFLLHLQERPDYDGRVLIKELASEQPSRSQLDQLHNEYAIARQLTGVAGVRPALGKEGTESRPVLLLEYIQGHSLAELIRSASLDLTEKLRLALNLTRALSHIHEHRVTHRDVSSGNILVAGSDSPDSQAGVYLIDFGLASTTGEECPSRLSPDDSLFGTLAYVSPEQTGRMNRQVDYRTDLYSLGVCLFELFTGKLPFGSGDALEMIHAHIARQPRPPRQVDAGIPGPVSDIILKLLAKNAEDRYQTADGLAADLQRCLDRWRSEGRIGSFELGVDDLSGRLQFPQKLYGRDAEIEQLKTTLDRAIGGAAQLLLVAGYSGVGKTSLVHEIQKDVITRQAAFVEGKFDQLQRTLPYSGWEQALTQLVNNWLAGGEDALAQWREIILDAVGDQARILIDFIPALECVVGPQPEVPQLGGIENQNRFNYIFGRFISSLATPEHPLVIFLDDLQWIDLASLKLIEALFATRSHDSFLVIGAYRSNEVGPDHPLTAAQDRLRADSECVTIVPLGDLTPDTTNQMLADTLHLPDRECRDLDRLLVEKTAGNPFYFRQLLYALEAESQLRFDCGQRCWVWDEGLGQSLQASGNVVELMVSRIKTLPDRTQHALSLAACLGSRFETPILGIVVGQPTVDILRTLSPAVQSGLIVESNGHYIFSHDRIQEAGYAMIPGSQRQKTHLKIGRSLLAGASGDVLEKKLFDIVGHLNAGRAMIETDTERTDLAVLNLRAGQKARDAAAYSGAKKYIETGLDLLRTNCWEEQYELTLSLHNENAELASLTGNLNQVSTIADLIHANAKSVLDQVRIYMTQIEAETAHSNLCEALEIGLRVLRALGIEIPEKPDAIDYRRLHDRLVTLLASRSGTDWAELPEMTDESALAASYLLASEMSTAYINRPQLYPIFAYQSAILTLEFGLSAWSPFFFGNIGLVTVSLIDLETPADVALDQMHFADKMRSIARQMMENPISARSRTKTLMLLTYVTPWIEPIEKSIALAQDTIRSGYEAGDLLYSSYGAYHFAIQSFAAGMNLEEYQEQLSDHTNSLRSMGQELAPQWLSIYLQTAQNFKESSSTPHVLTGPYFDEPKWLPNALSANDVLGRHTLYINKLILVYHFDIDDKLDECARQADELVGAGRTTFTIPQFYLYFTLAKLRRVERARLKDDPETMKLVDGYLKLVRVWSRSVPSTFQHKYDLIAAEKARVTGDTDGALTHYERAIAGAGKSGFIHEEALGNELYARFWAERGSERFAAPLLREAHSLYRKWGALAKAEHLTRRYPNWLIGRRIVADEPATRMITGEIADELDLRTVLKASQDIAGELALDSLLAKLMANVIENSGARQGFLILQESGQWAIVAESLVDAPKPYARTAKRIEETDELAKGIVHYVARTQRTVALEDASESGQFVNDPYVQANQARSILCTPLVNRGKTTAIIYLENNLAPRVFSQQRIGLLRLLSSQMAIAIENAHIHADLETLLESRSKALASAQAQVRTLFEDSPLGIALSSYEGRTLSANKAVLKMLRITEEELLQRSVLDFWGEPRDRDALLEQVRESGFVQDFGVQLLRRDGSPFNASLNVSRLVLEGNKVLLSMVEDVTAQITAEQESAILEERARLARELHDAVSQTILSASLLADATIRTLEKGRASATEDLKRLSRMLRGALDEMRTLLFELRPAALRDRTLGQLLGALTETARTRSRTTVDLEIKGDHELPERVTMTLHRIAQESLNNAVRHAAATTIKVTLVCDPDEVVLRIADDGLGYDVERSLAGHQGLGIMRERAEEIGAVLEIESRIGCGTQVTVTWS